MVLATSSIVFGSKKWYNVHMENGHLTYEKLNSLYKEILIQMLLSTKEQLDNSLLKLDEMSKQINETNATIRILTEQLAIANQRQFGRKTEKNLVLDEEEGQQLFFNEVEFEFDKGIVEEPDMETVVKSYRRKKKGKRDNDLSGFPVKIEEHTLSDEELAKLFPDGYRCLPDEVYRKLEMHPATYEVIEHHIKVYKGKKNGTVVKAKHPKEMLNNSIATPSLVATIINGKYTNAMPLYRQEQEFARQDVVISRQVMANWVIRLTEKYLSLVYDRMKKELFKCPVLHADKTPVCVNKDGREGVHKSWMWVYRTGILCDESPVVIYDYHKQRKQEHPIKFLEDFNGVIVSDGYQAYHNLAKMSENGLRNSSCWVHARRGFADVVKALGEKKAKGTVASKAIVLIRNIYREENKLADLSPEERLKQREKKVKPLVEAFFAWVKSEYGKGLPKEKTQEALKYCINQEQYLREFLTDGRIPIDNSAAERAIRGFAIGKHNWKLIDTLHGAEASAILYSLVETAKANNLKIYEYLKHLLTEIPEHDDETNLDFLEDLMPWSDSLPEVCRKKRID